MSTIGAIILAAGKGTRMRSRRPKVLHEIGGLPLVRWVIDAARAGGVAEMVAVVGHGAQEVRAALPADVAIAIQASQRGTGDATAVGLAALSPACDRVLVLCGDAPLIDADLIARLIAEHAAAGSLATMVTALMPEPGGYGRVVRDAAGAVEGVVEARDATEAELAITEVNSGVFCFERAALAAALPRVGADNSQGEIYLPGVLELMAGRVGAVVAPDALVAQGVNTRIELAVCEREIQQRLRERLMLGGVTMPDPAAVYLEAGVEVGEDSTLHPGTHLRGSSRIGSDCEIGPDVVICDSAIAQGARIVAAHLIDADVGPGCAVGPFAYLRPGARLEAGSRVGTYVEIKQTTLGPGARVPHLSYVGDAEVGADTNIGAGNITANYDGFRKHRTVIGARVKTGSDCVFVAPVTLGDDVMTGAGSILTDDVPAGALAIARARQSNIEGFTERATAKARDAEGPR